MLLDDSWHQQIGRVLLPFASEIDRAAIFGSRATGRARPSSDIDIVLYGSVTQEVVDRLWTLFEESDLPVTVDLVAYAAGLSPLLKHHIDACAEVMFTRDDLLSIVA